MASNKMLLPPTHPFVTAQIGNNQETRDAWGPFSRHRQEVMSLIQLARQEGDASIAIFGAGNCNDLDLSWLADAFPAVHLVDLDAQAIADGISSQGVAQRQPIHRHAPVDITGILHLLAPFLERPPTQEEFEVILQMLRGTPTPVLGATHDVVVSDCILSQMISTLTQLDLTEEQLISLTLAVRSHHLRVLVATLKPAGRALFITDLVSSDTLPELPGLDEREWQTTLQECLQTGNFFTGLNPEMVLQALKTDPYLREHIIYRRFNPPWRWDISDQRAYLVYAFLIGGVG